jgi:hypothetical protein
VSYDTWSSRILLIQPYCEWHAWLEASNAVERWRSTTNGKSLKPPIIEPAFATSSRRAPCRSRSRLARWGIIPMKKHKRSESRTTGLWRNTPARRSKAKAQQIPDRKLMAGAREKSEWRWNKRQSTPFGSDLRLAIAAGSIPRSIATAVSDGQMNVFLSCARINDRHQALYSCIRLN